MIEELVTVVVPIYNVEKYLERCMNSIVNQTYENLEIILVDDGSLDSCPRICDEWENRDSRIKVIHKKNAGLGMARNTGIEMATGQYICFVDSDDYILGDAIEKMYNMILDTQADMVLFGYDNVGKNGNVNSSVVPRSKKKFFQGTEVQKVFLPELIAHSENAYQMSGFHMSAWACMYSLELIKKVEWKFVSEREIIAEDVYSLLVLYKYVEKVAVLSEALYCYCENGTSLTHTYRKERYEKIRYFHEQCIAISRKLGYDQEIEKRLSAPFISFTIAAMKQIASAKISMKHKFQSLVQIIHDEYLSEVLRNLNGINQSRSRKIFFQALSWKCVLGTYLMLKIREN